MGRNPLRKGAVNDLRKAWKLRFHPGRMPLVMPDTPLISIVTPSFNQVRFLETTIRSVLEQDYPAIEYIIIDGGSTDGSLDIIRRYESRMAHWISEPDSGQAEAINKGLRLATGEIVAWLNSDDVYLPGALREAAEAFKRNRGAGLVYGDGIMVDEDLHVLDFHRYRPLDLVELLAFEVLLQPAAFMHRQALEAVGFLNQDYHLILDHELWVRIASRFPIVHVPRYWALERTHPQAKTIAQAGQFVLEAERLRQWAERDERLSPIMSVHGRRIYAGMEVFAARRLIDEGAFSRAFGHISRALRTHPPTVLRYWYKLIQALLSAIGLHGLFKSYRRLRRRIRFQGVQVEWQDPEWIQRFGEGRLPFWRH